MQPVQQTPDRRQVVSDTPIRHRINNFLAATVSRFRIILLVILIAAAAFLVGYFTYTEISKKLTSDSTVLAESAQDLYDKWQSESDVAQKGTLEKQLTDELGVLTSRYARQYGGERGFFIRASFNYDKKAWDNAQKDYQELAARFPNSYLAPVSLFDAGVCREAKGDVDGALKQYAKVAQAYQDSPVAPRAMFDVARLDEQKGQFDDAHKMYDQIDGLYPSSTWDKLAKDRLIELRVLGKVK
ncbi:MAG: tetratricopeptide repeat protein [Spirochaetia bacterium]